jgi:hypothetical protein
MKENRIKRFNENSELNISDVSSRTFRINKARKIYEDIFSLQSTEDYVGNDDLGNALTSITQYILKLEQC